MDHRLRHLAEQLDAGLIARREFLRKAAVITGGAPAGLALLDRMAEMNYQGPSRYKPALRDVTKLAKDIAGARGGLLSFAERVVNLNGQYFGVARLAFPGGLFVRKDLLDAKGIKMPKAYDPDVVEMAKKCQDPAKDRVNRVDGVFERRGHTEVATTAPDGPEQVLVLGGARR